MGEIDARRHGERERSPEAAVDLHQSEVSRVRIPLVLHHRDARPTQIGEETARALQHLLVQGDALSIAAAPAGERLVHAFVLKGVDDPALGGQELLAHTDARDPRLHQDGRDAEHLRRDRFEIFPVPHASDLQVEPLSFVPHLGGDGLENERKRKARVRRDVAKAGRGVDRDRRRDRHTHAFRQGQSLLLGVTALEPGLVGHGQPGERLEDFAARGDRHEGDVRRRNDEVEGFPLEQRAQLRDPLLDPKRRGRQSDRVPHVAGERHDRFGGFGAEPDLESRAPERAHDRQTAAVVVPEDENPSGQAPAAHRSRGNAVRVSQGSRPGTAARRGADEYIRLFWV